jgi:uridine kinase
MFDLKIFVDVDDDVRFIRRLRRDVVERGRTVDSVIGQYLASVKEMHDLYVAPQKFVADLIISWMTYNDRAVAMLNAWAASAL